MLPDGVPRPPFAAIFLVSALAGAFLGYQAAGVIAEAALGSGRLGRMPPGALEALAAGLGSLLGLTVFLTGSALSILVSIAAGYILQHHREDREDGDKREEGQRPAWRRTAARRRRRRERT